MAGNRDRLSQLVEFRLWSNAIKYDCRPCSLGIAGVVSDTKLVCKSYSIRIQRFATENRTWKIVPTHAAFWRWITLLVQSIVAAQHVTRGVHVRIPSELLLSIHHAWLFIATRSTILAEKEELGSIGSGRNAVAKALLHCVSLDPLRRGERSRLKADGYHAAGKFGVPGDRE